jgi:hypothetical protein
MKNLFRQHSTECCQGQPGFKTNTEKRKIMKREQRDEVSRKQLLSEEKGCKKKKRVKKKKKKQQLAKTFGSLTGIQAFHIALSYLILKLSPPLFTCITVAPNHFDFPSGLASTRCPMWNNGLPEIAGGAGGATLGGDISLSLPIVADSFTSGLKNPTFTPYSVKADLIDRDIEKKKV